MRKKFRAWDKKDKRWINDVWIDLDGTPYYQEYHTGVMDDYDQENIILVQFTGLKDANGVEIYEGDIVKTEGIKLEVKIGGYFENPITILSGNGNGVHYTNKEETKIIPASPSNIDSAVEVIGNIYENPELIK